MGFVVAIIMIAATFVASAGCDGGDALEHARRQDAAPPSSDASQDARAETPDSSHATKDAGKAGGDGGSGTGTGGVDAGGDAGANLGGGAGGAAGSGVPNDGGPFDSGAHDAQVRDDSCDEDAGTPQTDSFTVPSDGGHFEFCSSSGVVHLDFPAALAGMHITLTALDPHAFAWPHPGFAAAMSDVIRIETSTNITQPIRIKLPNGALLAFVFDGDSTVPLPLRLSEDRHSLELKRSGTLGILAPDRSCEATLGDPFTNAWQEEQNSGICSGFGARSTWRHYECSNKPFCQDIRSWCCVYPGDTRVGCSIDDEVVYDDFGRAGPNAAYPYCDDVSDSPYILDVSPAPLIANYIDQTMTLTGNNFLPGGYAYGGPDEESSNSDYVVQSTWISSTMVSVIVNGQVLNGLSEIWLKYANPDDSGSQFDGWRYSNSVRATVVPPAVSCPVPLDPSPAVGTCGSVPNGCQCSVDFDPGDGVHTYAMSCTNQTCTCTRDGLVVTTKPRINACNNDQTTQDQWRRSCLATPGFCP